MTSFKRDSVPRFIVNTGLMGCIRRLSQQKISFDQQNSKRPACKTKALSFFQELQLPAQGDTQQPAKASLKRRLIN